MNHKKKDEPPPWYQLYDINIKSYNEDPETHQNNELKRLEDKKRLGRRAASPERRIPLPINPPIYSHDQNPNFSKEFYQNIKADVQKIKEQNQNNNLQNKKKKNYEIPVQYFYPTSDDHDIREYQISCVENCLKQNTLISLPTGLGKTFVAAVVLYNYFRYYPDASSSRFLFFAPTKALIEQQVKDFLKLDLHMGFLFFFFTHHKNHRFPQYFPNSYYLQKCYYHPLQNRLRFLH